MKVVIDSNVLFRTLISQGNILRLIFNSDLDLFAPLKLKEEFNEKNFLKFATQSEQAVPLTGRGFSRQKFLCIPFFVAARPLESEK